MISHALGARRRSAPIYFFAQAIVLAENETSANHPILIECISSRFRRCESRLTICGATRSVHQIKADGPRMI